MSQPHQPTNEPPKSRNRLLLSGLLLAALLVGGAGGVAVSSLTGGTDTQGQASSASEPSAPPSDNTTADPTPPGPDVADLEFPDETTTGVPEGVELTETGSLTVTEDGATVDAMLIRGNVKVEADGVTITNSKIVNDSIYAIQLEPENKNLVVEDTEIDGGGVAHVAVTHGEYTLRRDNIHNAIDGPRIEGVNVLIEDSFIHSLSRIEDGHHDTIQIRKGVGVTIRGNNLQAYHAESDDPMNAAIQIGSLIGPLKDLRVEGNLMNGGNYTINASKTDPDHPSVYTNNVFGRDFRYGILSSGPNVQFDESNVWQDTGEPAT